MLGRIFPPQIDNNYRGHWLAAWLLALYLVVKTFASINAIGLNVLWSNREVLQGVEGVPLDTFGASAAGAATVLFAWWGVASLMPAVLGLIAVVRYRAMIPLIYLLMASTKIGEHVLADTSPTVGILGAGAPMPLIIIAVLLVGFFLSLQQRSVAR